MSCENARGPMDMFRYEGRGAIGVTFQRCVHERAVLTIDGPYVPPYPGTPYAGAPYPGAPYPGAPYPGTAYPGAPYSGTPAPGVPQTPESTSIVPTHSHDFDNDPNGGHS